MTFDTDTDPHPDMNFCPNCTVQISEYDEYCDRCEPVEPDGANGVKYPHVTVQLTGTDGNAFAIIGAVQKALRRAGVPADEITAFVTEATSGDYDNVLATAFRTVDVA